MKGFRDHRDLFVGFGYRNWIATVPRHSTARLLLTRISSGIVVEPPKVTRSERVLPQIRLVLAKYAHAAVCLSGSKPRKLCRSKSYAVFSNMTATWAPANAHPNPNHVPPSPLVSASPAPYINTALPQPLPPPQLSLCLLAKPRV